VVSGWPLPGLIHFKHVMDKKWDEARRWSGGRVSAKKYRMPRKQQAGEITEKKWAEARQWAGGRISKKKHRMPKRERPDGTVAGSYKRLASRFYQIKIGHCLAGYTSSG